MMNGITNGHAVTNGVIKTKHLNGNTDTNETSVEEFLQSVFDICLREGWTKGRDRNEPVINFKNPDELKKLVDFDIRDQSQGHHELLQHCQKIFQYSVKTSNPRFFNQLFAGLDPYGFAGQVVTDILNPSLYTYEVSPVFVLAEQTLLKKFRDIVGYKDGDGTFPPGGSYSNMLGMQLARFSKFPDVKQKGMRNLPQMVAFVSEDCHYSNCKNGFLLGIGTDNIIKVKCDGRGKMDVADLERCIVEATQQGAVPFIVVATSGTTVRGAYDPINPIADLCEKYKIWLHIDAVWGGGALFSEKHRYLCDGIERSDSVAWNPHKMMMAPIQCCMFITKHPKILKDCNWIPISYLFQQDKKLYDVSYDVGSKVVQCGRKVDALKFWLMWKAHGNNGFRDRIDKAFENSKYLADIVKRTEGFKLLWEPEGNNICFYYIPKSLRSTKFDLNDIDFCHKLSPVASVIKQRMTEAGSMLIGYQPLGKLPNFFRMIVISDEVTFEDMEFVVSEIDRLGRDL